MVFLSILTIIVFDALSRTLTLKRSGEIGENASFSDFNNEALFRAHNLSDEALEHEKAYKQFYK